MTEQIKFEDGIYLNLPAEEYHAAEALSNSGIKNLRVSPLVYWWRSPMNPAYEKSESTKGLKRGAMRHKYTLENENFLDDYFIKADKEDHPEALDTMDDLKAFMKEHGITPLSGSKRDLIARIRAAGFDDVQVWDEIANDGAESGKEPVTKEQLADLEFARRMLAPALPFITGGFPEVSIFWTHGASGVQLKARLDYLKVKRISDLKIFQNAMDFPIDEGVRRELDGRRMHLQGLMYLAAFEEAAEFFKRGKVFGLPDDPDAQKKTMARLKEIFDAGMPDFSFIFQLGSAPFEVRVRHFQQREGRNTSENVYWSNARNTLRTAIETFKRYRDHYGRDAWHSLDAIEKNISDDDMKWSIWDDAIS